MIWNLLIMHNILRFFLHCNSTGKQMAFLCATMLSMLCYCFPLLRELFDTWFTYLCYSFLIKCEIYFVCTWFKCGKFTYFFSISFIIHSPIRWMFTFVISPSLFLLGSLSQLNRVHVVVVHQTNISFNLLILWLIFSFAFFRFCFHYLASYPDYTKLNVFSSFIAIFYWTMVL